jgi:hypothetical protein
MSEEFDSLLILVSQAFDPDIAALHAADMVKTLSVDDVS